MTETEVKKYEDTVAGVLEMLVDDSTLDLVGATAIPDPAFRGVWLVTLKTGQNVVAWLAGYPELGGAIRMSNDFEVED